MHEMQEDYRRPTHVLEHKGLWRRCARFYRQVLIFQTEGMWRLLLQMWHKCGTNVPPQVLPRFSTLRQSKWKEIYDKTQN